jgi:hypothetical protein
MYQLSCQQMVSCDSFNLHDTDMANSHTNFLILKRKHCFIKRYQEGISVHFQMSIFVKFEVAYVPLFTPLRVGWPPTPQVYFGP